VAGDAALLVDPSDPQDIANKMHLLYKDEALRGRLIEKAREQVKKFDWARSAEKLWESMMRCLK
jgi:glycosyltransferase involved in cell wall biosynthesis